MTLGPALWLLLAVALVAGVEGVFLRRALHVFQLEGYKRDRFLSYRAPTRARALYLVGSEGKKPLVMTGRARRIYAAAVLVAAIPLYLLTLLFGSGSVLAAVAVLIVGGAGIFLLTDRVLVAGDVLVAPIQRRINGRYLEAAAFTLRKVAPLVIGITGSYGKTSTKSAVAGLLGDADDVLATPGSFNTPLGICRTINEEMSDRHRYFVVEMGAYREGDVAELCDFVHPSIGILTAIGPMHLDRFGSLDAIRRGKYEIVSSLPAGGIAVMNVDDLEVRALADATTDVQVVRYGIEPDGRPDITARDVQITPSGMSMRLVDMRTGRASRVTTRLLGKHAAGHVLAGVATAVAAGRSLGDLSPAISVLEPVEHRLQLIRGAGGVTVIDDAFNSNPKGAAAALEVLERMPAGRRLVVTPGIVELGEMQYEANRAFGALAGRVADAVIFVGKVNRQALSDGARGTETHISTSDSLAEATKLMANMIGPGDVVLFENDLPDQYEG
jgi:UDP-N-acetylmuramoyl-tripeptide--D-alanyl-D-alanine ligase